ncbi:Putative histone deacetylase complex subunit cti6 [Talaromyces islandicus]|uniref:Putative histone deacetylase complex subunit cti6 n=1 Tax=Talaromyces islandicus TaxID=28573 RepID=A0A0U1LY04_TALIS|nr:Putative histone deacetylase complex subunit cti6 [Talaromyces islandicus]
MSPRRSSRARTTQPSPALLQHTNSSSSGASLGRGDRNTRANHKISSPQRSSTQRSQSLDDSDGKPDLPQTRQRQRVRDEDNGAPSGRNGDAEDEDEDDENEEEEITRCLCGQQEYPGLPPSRQDSTARNGPHQVGAKDSSKLATIESDPLGEELGSMFIQCDSCKVWQHGGCVGIMDEAMSPDEYYCEQCRKDLHKVITESNGQLSSQYLPVAPVSSPRSPSRESSRDHSRSSRDAKSRQTDNPKRRSTMNSRDAAYDEEELLRRAIEESKEETRMSNDETSSRRTKRSRSDSEANKQAAVKRPRTSSPSPSAVSKQSMPASQPVSEDETKTKMNGANRPKRAAPSRNQRDKETKEPEEPESERVDTAGRRKSRSEKKRGDESDREAEPSPTKPPPTAAPVPAEQPEPSEATPETPVLPAEPTPAPRQSTRKSGRPPARRGGRVGRNQYTRERDANGDSNNSPNSPHGGQFRDNGRDSPSLSGPNGFHANGADSGKAGKARHLNPNRTSMSEMKRRVSAILDFISRMQVEMAASGETVTPPDNNGNGSSSRTLVKGVQEQLGNFLAMNGEGASTDGSTASVTDGEAAGRERDFKELTSVEMMDVLTRHLLKWQQEYGKYGEK